MAWFARRCFTSIAAGTVIAGSAAVDVFLVRHLPLRNVQVGDQDITEQGSSGSSASCRWPLVIARPLQPTETLERGQLYLQRAAAGGPSPTSSSSLPPLGEQTRLCECVALSHEFISNGSLQDVMVPSYHALLMPVTATTTCDAAAAGNADDVNEDACCGEATVEGGGAVVADEDMQFQGTVVAEPVLRVLPWPPLLLHHRTADRQPASGSWVALAATALGVAHLDDLGAADLAAAAGIDRHRRPVRLDRVSNEPSDIWPSPSVPAVDDGDDDDD